MTRLAWGTTPRLFETGVSRGVLYPPTGSGVPWNGLISVASKSDGGSSTEDGFYLDGRKYFDTKPKPDFEATIKAISTPPEFGVCDGEVVVRPGFILANQPRQRFGFCYRTELGDGSGYKIHMVYNALAVPASRTSESSSNSVKLVERSWDVDCIPPTVVGYRPTSHFILDSTKVPSAMMAVMEDVLYGSASTAPYLPLIADLIAYFD